MINKSNTLAVFIDFQEKLLPAMCEKEAVKEKTLKLASGLKEMNIPFIVTQQYTKGLGNTVTDIANALGEFEPVEKTCFGCMGNKDFAEKFENNKKLNVIVCGIEAHICVQQTVLQLLDAGYNVYIPIDCISSRNQADCLWSVARMEKAGAVITTYESILYELLGDSKAPEFKAISAIIK